MFATNMHNNICQLMVQSVWRKRISTIRQQALKRAEGTSKAKVARLLESTEKIVDLPFAGVLQGKDFGHFDRSGGFGQNLFLAFPCSLGACSLALAASLAALESSSVVACRSFRGSAGIPRWFLSVLPAFRATRGSVAHSVSHILSKLYASVSSQLV